MEADLSLPTQAALTLVMAAAMAAAPTLMATQAAAAGRVAILETADAVAVSQVLGNFQRLVQAAVVVAATPPQTIVQQVVVVASGFLAKAQAARRELQPVKVAAEDQAVQTVKHATHLGTAAHTAAARRVRTMAEATGLAQVVPFV